MKLYSFGVVIKGVTLIAPLIVWPALNDNAFETPKRGIVLLGVLSLITLQTANFFRGKAVPGSSSAAPKIVSFLLVLNALNLLYTANPYYTHVAFVMNAASLIFFHFVSLSVDQDDAAQLFKIIAFCGFIVSLLVLFQAAGHEIPFKSTGMAGKVSGTIGNSNSLGAYLIFPATVLIGMAALTHGKWRYVVVVLLIFVMAGMVISRARASWVGFCVAAFVSILLLMRIHGFSIRQFGRNNSRRTIGLGMVLILLLGAVLFVMPTRWHHNLTVESITDRTSLQFRKKYWQASWYLWNDRNPLLGTGLWSFRNLVYDAQAEINTHSPGFFQDYERPMPRRVHNEYLEILNDGGMVAAGILLLFYVVVMRHGFKVIRDSRLQKCTRVITATAFASVVGIMATAFFFFPFRISITLMMTSLMLGIMEGIYLRSYNLLRVHRRRNAFFSSVMIFPVFLILAVVFWNGCCRPVRSIREHRQYQAVLAKNLVDEAETHLTKALSFDPKNTSYCFDAACFYLFTKKDLPAAEKYMKRAFNYYNGDVVRWGLHYINGVLKSYSGKDNEAHAEFEKALYYNPHFDKAETILGEVGEP